MKLEGMKFVFLFFFICVLAIGVSGGPDSMALCALTAFWKAQGFNGKCDSEGFIDGILAIIVDHGLRAESTEEASIVSNRVAKMGTSLCADRLFGCLEFNIEKFSSRIYYKYKANVNFV